MSARGGDAVPTDVELLDALAAEYVLGTLDGGERLLLQRLLASDQAVRALVVGWEARLQGLGDATPRVRPPAALRRRVADAVRRADAAAGANVAAAAARTPSSEAAELLDLPPAWQVDIDLANRRAGNEDGFDETIPSSPAPMRVVVERPEAANEAVGGWRGAAVAASVVAAGLLALLVGQMAGAPGDGSGAQTAATVAAPAPGSEIAAAPSATATPPTALSLLRDGEGRPRYLVEIDETESSVRITSLDAEPVAADTSLQLWMADGGSGELRPIGLLPSDPWSSLRLESVPLVDDRPAFAVSEEPPGGSPEAGPTGSVVFEGTVHPLGD